MQPVDPNKLSLSPEPQLASSATLDSIGAQTIGLYQNQRSRTDRLWAHFSHFSAGLLAIGCALALYLNSTGGRSISRWVLVVPPVAYLLFVIGSRRALSSALTELELIRNIAVTKTPYMFKKVDETAALRLHTMMVVIALLVYSGACYLASIARP